MNLQHLSCKFVNNEISKMNSNKATGLDNVNVKILKIARPIIVHSLTDVMNLSLQTGIFPNEWKVAQVVPLHKGGNVNKWKVAQVVVLHKGGNVNDVGAPLPTNFHPSWQVRFSKERSIIKCTLFLWKMTS